MAADAGFKFPERYLNQQGYKLLNSNHVEEAIQVFDKQKAIHYYKKALELDPNLESAKKGLQQLGTQ